MNGVEKLRHIQDLLREHHTKEARPLIEELIHAEPSNVEVWYWRGVCERFDGELDLAENDFLSVIRQNPHHDRAFFGLGDILEDKGNHKDAVTAYQQAASLGNKEAAKKLARYGSPPIAKQPTVSLRPPSQKPLQEATKQSAKPEIELKTEKGIDYTRLRDLLAVGKWKEADQETEKLMYQAAGRNKARWGEAFPCADLRTLDNLWTHYSQGRFGFSIQREIWQRRCEGGRKFNRIIWNRFGSSVGWFDRGLWSTKSDLSFDESAPRGHLPAGMWAPQKSDVALNLLEAWWMLPQNQRLVKAQKCEAGWNGAALIGILSRLESCNALNSHQIEVTFPNDVVITKKTRTKWSIGTAILVFLVVLISPFVGLLIGLLGSSFKHSFPPKWFNFLSLIWIILSTIVIYPLLEQVVGYGAGILAIFAMIIEIILLILLWRIPAGE